jgi:hypothetical protein
MQNLFTIFQNNVNKKVTSIFFFLKNFDSDFKILYLRNSEFLLRKDKNQRKEKTAEYLEIIKVSNFM